MMVVPIIGRKGDPVCEIDGILCLFDRRGKQPQAGVEIEVMITHAPPHRWKDGYGQMSDEDKKRNPPTIPFLFVRPVTSDDVLVNHDGFECSGTMCRTTASISKDCAWRKLGWITPGRTPIVEVSNVNARFDRREPTPPIPGQAYVSLKDHREGHSRIAGVPTLNELNAYVLKLAVRRKAFSRIGLDRETGKCNHSALTEFAPAG